MLRNSSSGSSRDGMFGGTEIHPEEPARNVRYIKNVRARRQFRRRMLLVDSNEGLLLSCSHALLAKGYEVLTARNGFEALNILRGAKPDLLITELNLPHMSGFELLSVVRKRFPMIAVIATSGEYSAITMPRETICDAFVPKGADFLSELVEEVGGLVTESPIRASPAKALVAPVWIPRSMNGHIVLTCPECLRTFSTSEPQSGAVHETCVFCGTDVRFRMGGTPTTAQQRSIEARHKADKIIVRSRKLRTKTRD